MSNYSNKDIVVAFRGINNRIDELWCFVKECCQKVPMNIGSGAGVYKRLYNKKWEFKSLIEGSNISIVENDNDITISSTAGPTFIESITDTATINLTVTGTALSADFTSLLISQFTNDSGYITSSGAALTSTYVGYGGAGNTLTGNSLFHYDIAAGLFNVEFPGSVSGAQMAFYGGLTSSFYVGNATTELSIIDTNASTLKTNGVFGLKIGGGFDEVYTIGDYLTSNAGTHIYIDDNGLARSILLNATNGVTVSNLAGVGTRMVTASATGLLSTATITTGTVTNVSATNAQGVTWTITNPTTTPDLTIALGALTGVTSLNGLIVTANTGVITTGTWNASVISEIYGGTNQSTYTQGDILYASAANTLSKLPIGSASDVLTVTAGIPSWAAPSTAATTVPISGLLAAIATNTINNTNYLQEWQWNTLDGNSGLKLSSTSTAASSNLQKVFEIALSGANGTATQTTYGSYITNTHTGATSTNVAGYFSATGGTNNYAIIVPSGRVGIGITAPTATLHLVDNSVTTGISANFTSTSITSGNVISASAVTTTAASNTQAVIKASLSGTMATSSQTTHAIWGSNTHAGNVSEVRIGVRGEASGGSAYGTGGTNYGGYFSVGGGGSYSYGVYGTNTTSTNVASYGGYFTNSGTSNGHSIYGVYGDAAGAGTAGGSSYGVYGNCNGVSTVNSNIYYGVYGNVNVTNNWASGENYGGKFVAVGGGTGTLKCYGVYASATGATNNYGLIVAAGLTGIGVTTPTARLHITAGTATASTAPLKFTSGTLLTASEVGAVEFLTDAYYATVTTNTIRKMLVASTTGRTTAQSAANASVATYVLGAADQTFEVSANVLVTTSSAENFTVTCAYTDEGNTARTLTLPFTTLAGASVAVVNFANGAVPYAGIVCHIRVKASTTITIATTGTFTGATYNCEGIIKRTA